MTKTAVKTDDLDLARRDAARRIREGHERAERGEREWQGGDEQVRQGQRQIAIGRDEWAIGILQVAVAVWDARQTFTEDREFSAWFNAAHLDELFNANDRAALVGMGRNPDVTKEALATTERRSLQHLWRAEIQPRVEQRLTRPRAEPEVLSSPSPDKTTTPKIKRRIRDIAKTAGAAIEPVGVDHRGFDPPGSLADKNIEASNSAEKGALGQVATV